MGFKLPESFYEKQREIYEKKYVTYEGKEIHISEFKDRSVTPEMNSTMRMNSYAQDDLPPKLTDEALVVIAKYYLDNCSQPKFPCTAYDEALVHKILPEFIKRLEETL